MGKHVVVIASGETERRSLPHLLRHLEDDGIVIIDVRIPPGNKALNLDMAERLVKSAWYEKHESPPDKFVILADVDGKVPDQVLRPFRDSLAERVGPKVKASLRFAYAQWHLEAWYFADDAGIRAYLGGAPGDIDTSTPDTIQNPKLHLKHLLGDRAYTAVVSEEIATSIDARKIAQRSPSFQGFLEAVRNGSS